MNTLPKCWCAKLSALKWKNYMCLPNHAFNWILRRPSAYFCIFQQFPFSLDNGLRCNNNSNNPFSINGDCTENSGFIVTFCDTRKSLEHMRQQKHHVCHLSFFFFFNPFEFFFSLKNDVPCIRVYGSMKSAKYSQQG